jgi:hypothetical protein
MLSLADNKHISSFFTKKRNLSVFLFFLIINLAFCSGHIGGDGFLVYLTAESLVLDGNINLINIPPDFDITEQKRNYDRALEAIENRKADGKDDFYSYYGLAMVLGEAPFYLIGHLAHKILPVVKHDYMTMFSVSLLNCFISALLGLYIYLFALRISGSEKRSFLLSSGVIFGTFLFAYALKSGYSEPMMTLTIFASFYHAFKFRETDDKMQLIFSGLYGGAAINSKSYGFLVIGMVGIYVIWLAYKKASGLNRLAIIGYFLRGHFTFY